MPLPDDPHASAEWYSLWAALALAGVTWVWKSVFGAKKDLRADQKDSLINGTYEGTLKMLQASLERCEHKVAERDAEIERLRALVRTLGGAP